MPKDNFVYLKHILDSVYRIETYITDVAKDDFVAEVGMVQTAVVRELEIIGEAARNVEDEFKKQHPEIPWRDMVDTRNKIIHDYMSVDYDLVWEITKKDLPLLKTQIEKVLSQTP